MSNKVLDDEGNPYVESKYERVDTKWAQVGDTVRLSDYRFQWEVRHTTNDGATCFINSLVGNRKARVPNGFFIDVERQVGFVPTDNRDEYKTAVLDWKY